MAKKGQKFNTYSKEFRWKMIQELKIKTVSAVVKKFNVNLSTNYSYKL